MRRWRFPRPGADHEARCAREPEVLALQPAREARAVEHVAHQLAVGTYEHGVAGSGDLHGGRHLVEQRDGRDLVRHRHERAANVGQLEQPI